MKQRSDIPAVVSQGPAFRGLPGASIRTVLERASRLEYFPRGFLYRQGDPARNFFVLESGLLSLTEVTPGGDRTVIRFILPGEPTGYVAISEIREYVMSAEVLKPSKVFVWERETALQLIREIPGEAANLLNSMISDVVYYHLHTRRLKTDPLEQRIAWGLLELARARGKPTAKHIDIEYSGHQHLAELAGTNIYAVSRELSKLERRGALRRERGRILLLESGRLNGATADTPAVRSR